MVATTWLAEVEVPSEGFYRAFADRVREGGDPSAAARAAAGEAVCRLLPAVDWPAYLPHVPHGLLGLEAVFRLEPLLAPASFLRLLATQLHAFALEVRAAKGQGLAALGQGSGHWGNLEMALRSHRPAIAWGEALGLADPAPEAFGRLARWVEPDMANVGHKAVMALRLEGLAALLDQPRVTRLLLALTAWLGASEPCDTFWHDRAAHRLGEAPPVPFRPSSQTPAAHQAGVREICDSGLVELLDHFTGRVATAGGSGDLLAMLVLAAAEKQLDARRDLEGRTAWTFVYLASLALRTARAGEGGAASWVQAAALVNLFPTGEEEERPGPVPPRAAVADPGTALLEAVLDGEPPQAMFLAGALRGAEGSQAVLRVLAEAASGNDPSFNHSHQLLAVAAGADLLPLLPDHAQAALLEALAKFLANAQGSSDLGRLADAAFVR